MSSLRWAVEKDPKFVRAWLLLGTLLAARRDRDLAIEAFRSAVSADPNQPASYKLLGFALMASQKLDEAVSVWQKLAKITPEDSDAEANLGTALNLLKRYDEAASALESAVKLSPSKVSLRLSLGSVYLSAGDSDKARAAFQEAIKLDPSTTVLNDVAYALADKNLDLNTAKEYSERAIQQEEQASAKIQSSVVNASDVERTLKLANFWDTLGWIYFRLNELEQAENYLKPAWSVLQSPDIGEHLGRVYEKLHQKQLALHTYQLAWAAGSSFKDNPLIRDDIHRLGATDSHPWGGAELSEMRTVRLPRIVSGTAQAEFFIILGPGHNSDAKFLTGSDSLKNAAKTIASSKFNIILPGESAARIVLRGIVGCYQYSGCSIVMMTTPQTSQLSLTP